MKISIVVPIYYKSELYLTIEKCLDSIEKYYPDFHLITLDDCSPTKSPFKTTLKNEKNMGFTASVNKLLKEAFKTADIVIVANDDLEFKEGDLDHFKEIENIDGIYSPRDTASGNLDTFGAIWGMNKNTYKKLGPMNEKFVNYFSDADYYNRAKKIGLPVVKWKDVVVTHHESSTFNLVNKKELYEKDQKNIGN
jgi:GT2 family glycosyltransferase